MIEFLEQTFRQTLKQRGRSAPHAVHICKLGHEAYPSPATALVFLLFEDDAPHPSAVAKIARTAAADTAVQAEWKGVALAQQILPPECRAAVPENLAAGELNGRAFGLWTAQPGRGDWHHTFTLRDARRASRRIEAALRWAAGAAQATRRAATTANEWLGPWESVRASLQEGGLEPALASRVEARLEPIWQRPWAAALAHGDFFPGNVLFDGDRVSGVIDWGGATSRAPVFVDPLMYERSFALHTLGTGRRFDTATLHAIAALPAFDRDRAANARETGIDTRPGTAVRLLAATAGLLRELEGGPARLAAARNGLRLLAVEAAITTEEGDLGRE